MNPLDKQKYKIAIAFDLGISPNTNIHDGILRYAQKNPAFYFRFSGNETLQSISELKNLHFDGAIVAVTNQKSFELIESYPFPVVNISASMEKTLQPRIYRDHKKSGSIAAEQLFAIGLQSYGYIGFKNFWYSQLRLGAFRESLKKKGFDSKVLFVNHFSNYREEEILIKKIYDWVNNLEKPVGILIDDVFIYSVIVEITKKLNLQIPEDISIISINNNTASRIIKPSLSTIDFSNVEIGYKAMELLHELIINPKAETEHDILLEGVEYFPRESTDTINITNPVLKKAVHFIKANIDRLFTMEEVLSEVKVSRRWLESYFKKELKKTPAKFIKEMRIKKAKYFIEETPYIDDEQLVKLCGFSSIRHLRSTFEHNEKQTLEEYRIYIASSQ
jgi:LacI family transcriptional regulator